MCKILISRKIKINFRKNLLWVEIPFFSKNCPELFQKKFFIHESLSREILRLPFVFFNILKHFLHNFIRNLENPIKIEKFSLVTSFPFFNFNYRTKRIWYVLKLYVPRVGGGEFCELDPFQNILFWSGLAPNLDR